MGSASFARGCRRRVVSQNKTTARSLVDESELGVGVANSRRGGNGRPEGGNAAAHVHNARPRGRWRQTTSSAQPVRIHGRFRPATQVAPAPHNTAAGCASARRKENATRAVYVIFRRHPIIKHCSGDSQGEKKQTMSSIESNHCSKRARAFMSRVRLASAERYTT